MIKRKKISIVTPCYNESETIQDCYHKVSSVFETKLKNYDLEYIFTDNCSSDNTVDILEKIAEKDKRIKIIVNANNFGVFRSMYNGLINTTGDAVVPFLPADLQDPPELLIDFIFKWEEGYKVVYGQRNVRQESFYKRKMRALYYRFLHKYSYAKHPLNAGEFQLIDKQVVSVLRQYDDYQPYIRGMIANCGFKSIGIPYTWKERKKGQSKTGWLAMIDQGLNGIVSSTNAPIRFGMTIGLIISFISVCFAMFNVTLYVMSSTPLANKGIMLIISGLFFFGGVQLFFTALVGEYVASIHSQVRKGPLVVEERRINF